LLLDTFYRKLETYLIVQGTNTNDLLFFGAMYKFSYFLFTYMGVCISLFGTFVEHWGSFGGISFPLAQCLIIHVCFEGSKFPFSALTLLVGRQDEGHTAKIHAAQVHLEVLETGPNLGLLVT